MAGNWIKFETATSDKPEIWTIATALDIDPDAVVGKLLRVWAWFDEQTESGNAPSVTKALLDQRVGVTGFVGAMIDAGWMTESEGVLTLPNFDRHNGQTAKTRALTAKRVAKHKKSNAGGNAPSVTGALPREEKNTEENKNPLKSPKEDEWFDRFWSVVHVRKGKDAARKAFGSAVKRFARELGSDDQKAAEQIIGRMAEFAKSDDAHPDPARRAPIHPATWLNQGRFQDEDSPSASPAIPDRRPTTLAEAATTPNRMRTTNAQL